MEQPLPAEFRLAGWFLVGGALAILGGCWPPYRQWSSSLEEGFRVIAAHPIGWWCIHGGFFLGTVLSTIGVSLLASALQRRGAGGWAVVATVAFGLAAAAWTLNLAYRVSVWNWAAETFVATGQTPDVFLPLHRWAGRLFGVFSLVGYGSIAALGLATLRADLGPVWLRWATLGFGLSGGLVVGTYVPLMMYIPFVAWGVVLLRS